MIVIRASPDICADARYYASLIFIVAISVKLTATMNYARRANNGRRPNYMRNIVTPEGQITCEAQMTAKRNNARQRSAYSPPF